jgi:hypothetical protein
MILVVLLAGCGVSRESRLAQAEERVAKSADLAPVTETGGLETGTLAIDYVLIDLDADAAQRLLGIDSPSDISPRTFKQPMGELIAVEVFEGEIGRVLDAGRWSAPPDQRVDINVVRRIPYLRDYRCRGAGTKSDPYHGDGVPVLDALDVGVTGALRAAKADVRYSLNLETDSAQLLEPMPRFTTSLGLGNLVFIHIPELIKVHRVAAETVQPGETAMFQLSRAGNRESARVRLLFVRVATPES